jgi:hypothetical protein
MENQMPRQNWELMRFTRQTPVKEKREKNQE